MKTIKDIIKYVSMDELNRCLSYLYPKDKYNYTDAYNKIKEMKRSKGFNGELTITFRREIEDDKIDFEAYYLGLCEFGKDYSSSFLDWKKFANTPIEQSALDNYKYAEIVAHFIWDITYFGTEEEMKERQQEIFGKTKKALSSNGQDI